MKKVLFICIITLAARSVTSQTLPISAGTAVEASQESLTLHLNSTLFLAGETLLYKIYCLTHNTGTLSPLSSLAYVELINENGKPILQTKIILTNGLGAGEFFLADNIPSGNYTLLSYTKWMRNFSHDDFFQTTITVVNPSDISSANATAGSDRMVADNNGYQQKSDTPISSRLNKKEFGYRDKVSLQLPAHVGKSGFFSVNVRLKTKTYTSFHPWDIRSGISARSTNTRMLLPDVRGELLSGTVVHKETGKPLAEGLVTISSPSKNFAFLISLTDSTGKYYFNGSRLASDFLLLSVYNDDNNKYEFRSDSTFLNGYVEFVPPKLSIEAAAMKDLEARYLSMQVENVFYAAKRDSIVAFHGPGRFFGPPDKDYNLDNFTRFQTMEDVFREIIPEVVVKEKNGDVSLTMKNVDTGEHFRNSPLILIDGIPVYDEMIIMNYDPILIKTVSVITQHYYYGGLETDGILSIETYNGDAGNISTAHMQRLNYMQPQSSKIYNSPDYGKEKNLNRVPDFRTQLYWNPSIKIKAGAAETLMFYTGDISGEYIVEIVGISDNGERIYEQQNFTVR